MRGSDAARRWRSALRTLAAGEDRSACVVRVHTSSVAVHSGCRRYASVAVRDVPRSLLSRRQARCMSGGAGDQGDHGKRGDTAAGGGGGGAGGGGGKGGADQSSMFSTGSYGITKQGRQLRWLTLALSAHRGMLWGCGLALAVGAFLFLFKDSLREDTANQTADVAKRVLAEQQVQQQAFEATKDIVGNILRDDPSLHLLVALLKKLLQNPETQEQLVVLLKKLFEHPATKENTKVFVAQILSDQWIVDQVIALANTGLHQLCKDENLKAQLVDFLKNVVSQTISDAHIQHMTGEALYGATKVWLGFGPSNRPRSKQEERLLSENADMQAMVRSTRLEIAQLQAQLISLEHHHKALQGTGVK